VGRDRHPGAFAGILAFIIGSNLLGDANPDRLALWLLAGYSACLAEFVAVRVVDWWKLPPPDALPAAFGGRENTNSEPSTEL
jgi:hypothetical protein